MEYTIVIEKGEEGYWVYSPQLLGCTSYGETIEQARKKMKEAIRAHIEVMREHGDEIQMPRKTIVEKLAV